MVPHLVTALKGPLLDLERRILDATPQIERWFRLEWQEHTPPFYASVDLRNAGYKLTPVDINLFPDSFDNLSSDMLPLAQQAAMAAIEKYCPDAHALLLLADSRRHDAGNLRSLAQLAALLRRTGLTVRIGSTDPDLQVATRVEMPHGQSLTFEPLRRNGRRLGLKDFDPCTVVLNDDVGDAHPALLDGLTEQTLVPPLHAGWATRRRANHLAAYNDVAKKFAKSLGLDAWLLNPYFARAASIDLHDRASRERLAAQVEALLKQIRSKYREYGVTDAPFVVVKSDSGAHDLSVMPLRDSADVLDWASKAVRRKPFAQGGNPQVDLVLQEGVPTFETMNQGSAEPVVQTIDRYVIGGFYRVNPARARDQDLEAPGTRRVPLPFATSCNMPDAHEPADHAQNRFYAYGVVARLAVLAASIELERTDPDQSLYG